MIKPGKRYMLNLEGKPANKAAAARRAVKTARATAVLEALPGDAIRDSFVCACGDRVITIGRATCHRCEARFPPGVA